MARAITLCLARGCGITAPPPSSLLAPAERFVWRVRSMVATNLVRPGSSMRLTDRLLLNTGHSGLEQADYRRRIERHGLQPFFYLHDLIPLTHPQYCRAGEGERHRPMERFPLAIDEAEVLARNDGAGERVFAGDHDARD